jgi:hypothetical protein
MKLNKDLKLRILNFDGNGFNYTVLKEFKFNVIKELKHVAFIEVMFRCQCNRCDLCRGPKSKNWIIVDVFAFNKKLGALAKYLGAV